MLLTYNHNLVIASSSWFSSVARETPLIISELIFAQVFHLVAVPTYDFYSLSCHAP